MQIDKKVIDEFFKQLEQGEQDKKEFFEESQDSVLEKIYKSAKKDSWKTIDSELIAYNPEDYPLSDKEFYFLFENIFNYAEHEGFTLYDEDINFYNRHVIFQYKDVYFKLFEMSGQGTVVILNTIDDDNSQFTEAKEKNSIFKYESVSYFD